MLSRLPDGPVGVLPGYYVMIGVLGMSSGTINALGRRISLLCGRSMTTLFVLVLVLKCIRVLRPEPLHVVLVLLVGPGVFLMGPCVLPLCCGETVTIWYGRLWSVVPVSLSVRLSLLLAAETSSASMWLAVDLLCLLRNLLTPRDTLWAWAPGTLTTTVLLSGACCA